MEAINFDDTAKELIRELEVTLGKLALAADSGISTSNLEGKAQKLAGILKSSVDLFSGLSLYKDVKGSEVYSWTLDSTLPDGIFVKYANLCKRCKEALPVREENDIYFAKISENIFVNLSDLPEVEFPQFKVKIEGNTLMAVRADLLAKLPDKTRKLLLNNEEEKDE